MASFKDRLEKNKQNHAYMMGVDAAYRNEQMISPFDKGSKAESEWLDGFLDAVFLRNLK